MTDPPDTSCNQRPTHPFAIRQQRALRRLCAPVRVLGVLLTADVPISIGLLGRRTEHSEGFGLLRRLSCQQLRMVSDRIVVWRLIWSGPHS